METTIRNKVIHLSKEAALIAVALVSAVLLPQIVHAIGVLAGVGGMLGQILLPMYIPVLIIGFYRGPVSGILTGLAAPLVSFAITQMPAESILPYITVELVAMGALAGFLSNVKLFPTLRVLAVQLGAKVMRIAIFACYLYFAGREITAAALFGDIGRSLPGVALQLILLTVLLISKQKDRHADRA